MMRLNRLVASAMVIVLGAGVISGCTKEDSKNVTTAAVVTEATTQENAQETTTAQEVTEEVTTVAEGTTEAGSGEDIALVNPFLVFAGESEPDARIPATPEMEFNADVELGLSQLTWIELGKMSTDMGYLKLSDMFDAGFVGADGEKVFAEGSGGWMDVYSKDLNIAIYDDNEGGPYVAQLHIDENIHNEGDGVADISVKLTEFGLEIGQSVEVLKPLGTPDYAMLIRGEYYYYWQVETEDKGCCIEAITKDGVIVGLAVEVF